MPLSTHGGNGADGGKGKYPLNTSQKKNFIHSVHQTYISQTLTNNIMSQYAVRRLSSPMGSLPPPCYPFRRKSRKSSTFTFSDVTHSRKSGNYTDAAGVRRGITYTVPCKCCMKKWRCFSMRNPKLVPYETIVRATSGEPEAVDEVLQHYSRQIRLAALENGHINKDTEDSIKRRLVAALFQFRLDGQAT